MSSTDEIAQRLKHFADHIQQWRQEAARLTLLASQAREGLSSQTDLIALEETAGAVYADIAAFQATVDEVAERSPAAAAELAPVTDAIRLVLLEITELGVRLYSEHSGIPHSGQS